jgi:pimeloyl-ACP methyl ester carboxylesterase
MTQHSSSASHGPSLRCAGLAGRAHGDERAPGAPFVFLHGLTFDNRMWGPVLDALPSSHRAIAFDLPGHGGSAPLPQHGGGVVADAIHEAVLDAGLDAPIVVGHAIGGPLATLYASRHPAAAVVSVDAPVRLGPFAQLLRSLHPQLAGDGFRQAWAIYQDGWHVELLPAADRALLRASDRPGDVALQQLVLSYQSDLLERPLAEVLRERDEGQRRLRAAGTPYLTLHSCPLDPSDAAWLRERLPQAEIHVWPVGHHFPHLSHPGRFVALLTGLAAGRVSRPPSPPMALGDGPGNKSRLRTSSDNEQTSDNSKRKGRK